MRTTLAILVCLFCLTAVADKRPAKSGASACNCTVTQPSAPPDSRGTERSLLSVKVTELPAKTPAEVAQDVRDRDEKTLTDRWTIGLAVATAVILFLQLFVFGYQALELNKSIKEAKRATGATRIAARAAKQTVTTMNLTARRDLRAYVAVLMSSIERLDENRNPRATVVIKNFGKTPAYRFAPSAFLIYVEPDTAPPDPPEPTRELGHLAPGAEFNVVLNADWQLSRAMRANIVVGSAAVYVQGIIKYVDTYGEPRFTQFRVMTDGAASVPAGRLVSCTTWNETDDDAAILAAATRRAMSLPPA
jgi:hypothetical protein